MPLSDPILTSVYSNAPGSTDFTTDSGSYTDGDLVVICVASEEGNYLSSLSQTFSAGSWTIDAGASTTYGTAGIAVCYAYCQVTATGSGTITGTMNASCSQRVNGHAYRVPAGFDTTTPIAQDKRFSETTLASIEDGDQVTGTFDSTPSSNSALLCLAAQATLNNGFLALSGWTEGQHHYGGNIPTQTSVDSGSTSTTFGAEVEFANQDDVVVVLGIEIQEAAAGGTAKRLVNGGLVNSGLINSGLVG